ncbi:MAG: UDP-3-O-(3-hydroxymyristoyl)glucosamine N-acyltransferase [Armatimonadaceae bacterium]
MKDRSKSLTVAQLAEIVKGRIYGDPQTIIRGIASIHEARPGDITFAESIRYLQNAEQSHASAIVVPETAGGGNATKVRIEVANPRLAFAQLLEMFAPEQFLERGVHPTAVVGSDLRHGENISVGANAVIGENVRIGNNVIIHPLCYVGDDVEIGDNTVLMPQVTLLRGTIVGSGCIIHSGTVLGADGFGYLPMGGKQRKIPQIGNVAVGDEVEIGANSTVDRARTGTTRIGSGTKIDNLVHVGHNCQIGCDCIIIAQVGMAGGVEVGDGVIIAGQAGIKEQVKIGARAVVGAQTGVMGDVPAGAYVSGYGAKPHKEVLRTAAAMNRLPDMMDRFRNMEKRLKELEARLEAVTGSSLPAVESAGEDSASEMA